MLTRHSNISIIFAIIFILFVTGSLQAGDFVIERVSISTTGTEGGGEDPSLSADGRYIAFQTTTSLVPADTINSDDVYVRDRVLGITTLVSVNNAGEPGNGLSNDPDISDDGKRIVFHSQASNLRSGDVVGSWDIFVRDLETEETIFVGPAGSQPAPAISGDGKFVAYASNIPDIVPADTDSIVDIFVYEIATGQTVLASQSTAGVKSTGTSNYPDLNYDGSKVVFHSGSGLLVLDDDNHTDDAFVRDLVNNTTTRVSVSGAGVQGNNPSRYPGISGDGRYVAFSSGATTLVTPATSGTEIFVKDLMTNATFLISHASNGDDGNGTSNEPEMNYDGRFVTYFSTATNLISNDQNGATRDVFLYDRDSGETTLISQRQNGTQGGLSTNQKISAEGNWVAFSSGSAFVGTFGGVFVAYNIFLPNPAPIPTPDAPNAAPARNYFTELPVIITWTPVTWASEYEVQVADNSQFSQPESYSVAANDLAQPLDSLTDGIYYWRVRARQSDGNWGVWSQTERFELSTAD